MSKLLTFIVLLSVSGINSVRAATPTLVQHLSTFLNFEGEDGNPYYISLPNLTGAGNTLVMGVSYAYATGMTMAVSDDKGNTWTLGPSTPSSPSAGQEVSRIYYATNVMAGTDKIKVTFNTSNYYFQAVVSEFYNVASASPADGSSGNASSSAPDITAGSFTTTTAGDLLYFYGFDSSPGGALTNFTEPSGWTLLSADNQWGMVAQYAIQASAGATNPALTATAGSDSFNAVALALKSASQGTAPAGIRIVHVYHTFFNANTPIQFPTSGNLLLVNTAFSSNQNDLIAMSSNPGNTWTYLSPYAAPQIWFATNATTSSTLIVKPTVSSLGVTLVLYDVTGATASPYDTAAGNPTASTNSAANQTIFYNMPAITPTTNGLVFVVMANGIGPTTNMVGGGQILDSITYGGQIDASTMDNSDGYGHYFNSTGGAVSFGWDMNSSSLPNSSEAMAIAFKAAASQNIIAPQITAVAFSNNSFVVSFKTVPTQTYGLQSKSNLAIGSWSSVVTNIPGTGGIVRATDTNAVRHSQLFYRVKTTF